MKRKSHPSKKAPDPTEVPAAEYLSNMEAIANTENDIADEFEATERDYDGRSTQEEDGAVPVTPPDQNPISADLLRRPSGPPKHNM